MITVENLSKQFGNYRAVDAISFSVNDGEIFAFLGVNGAGKTTTIRMMTGILKPTTGSIFLNGIDLAKNPELAKSITGYIPDRPYLYPKLAGREFLYFIAELYKVPPQETESRIDQVLQEYSLQNWGNDLIENYSHGMKQRLATCAALLHHPKVLIFDEPMVGLDPHGARHLKERMKSYAQNGVSVLLSTHSLNVAEEVADKVAIINRGKIIAQGSIQEIREKHSLGDGNLEALFLELTSEVSLAEAV